jgi:hypothetical protein
LRANGRTCGVALALADRATTRVTLHAPYDILSSNLGIAILVILLTVELTVDKIPGVDHVNDLIQSFVRPAAGAIAAVAATGGVVAINPAVMVLVGVLLAGSVNAVKVGQARKATPTGARTSWAWCCAGMALSAPSP